MNEKTDKNYYTILKIQKNASDKEIKSSYRKLAMEFHPDINAGKDSEKKFKEISEAYSVLSDSKKRQLYDRTGSSDYFNFFNDNSVFGGMPRGSFCGGRGMGMGRRCGGMGRFIRQRFGVLRKEENTENNDIIFNLPLSTDEAVNGTEKEISLNRGPSVKQFRVIIAPGVEDGDLIKIQADNFKKNDENYYLRVSIIS